jgi:hypothetical protein
MGRDEWAAGVVRGRQGSDISHDQHAVRLAKLQELRAAGAGPVPGQLPDHPFFG